MTLNFGTVLRNLFDSPNKHVADWDPDVDIKVVGVGGGGGNAVRRIAAGRLPGVDLLALNTDVQALRTLRDVTTFAIGPDTTGGMGSGGDPDLGRKSIRETAGQIARLLEGADMVFVAAGMGGGTGTGAAPLVAEIARKQGALTVAIVTRPFSFEGPARSEIASTGIQRLARKVDAIITVDNDRLLSSVDGDVTLDNAFELADRALQQGVAGISEIIAVPGLINVDFADVRTTMAKSGPAFMAMGEGRGESAAPDAVDAALDSPLFDAPLERAKGLLLNVKGGPDLSLAQVHEMAGAIQSAADANVIFGVVQEPRWKQRVQVTLVATGLTPTDESTLHESQAQPQTLEQAAAPLNGANGHHSLETVASTQRML